MGLNVLIADDSTMMRSMISKTLQMSGLPLDVIYMAENGKECIKILSDTWIDLLFLDLNMPVLDGYQVVQRILQDDTLKDTPIIVVSADSNRHRLEQLKSEGIRAFVRKPFTPEVFKRTVVKAMGGIDLD